MVGPQERLQPVRCLIDHSLLQRLETWGQILACRPSVAVHYGDTLPLSYAARTALLIGLEELKESEEAPLVDYELEGLPCALGVAMPRWFREELDTTAKRFKLSRVQVIRLALDRGLPR